MEQKEKSIKVFVVKDLLVKFGNQTVLIPEGESGDIVCSEGDMVDVRIDGVVYRLNRTDLV